jgi:hypothetical protein
MNALSPKTIIRLHHGAIFDDQIQLFMAQRFDDGRIAVAMPLTMKIIDPSEFVPSDLPLFSFDPTTAQHLMDELWNLGIRPTEGHGSTGQLAATEKHLDHVSTLLSDAFKTVQNVVNASLVTQHQIPLPPKV